MALPTLTKLTPASPWDERARKIINAALDLLVDAGTTVPGLLEIATDAEAVAKTAADKALVPSNLAGLGATDSFAGLIEIATDAEALAVTATDKALVPSNFSGKAGQQTYVEGAWTPELSFGGATTGITYSSRSAAYTRIGRIVHFHLAMNLSSKGSATGVMAVTGPTSHTSAGEQALSVRINNMTSGVGDTMLSAVVGGGSTTLQIFKTALGATSILSDADFTNNSTIRLTGTYRHTI